MAKSLATITIELNEEDRARIDRFITAVEYVLVKKIETPTESAEDTEAQRRRPAVEEPIKDEPAEITEPAESTEPAEITEPAESKKTEPGCTVEDLQAIIMRLVRSGAKNRDAAKNVITAYADRLSNIPADKYDEVMKKLTEIEEGD